jgi:histidinol dehydrogenase
MFMKVNTYMETDLKASLQLAKYAETQAAYEKMDAHRYAATIRLENLED